MATKTFRFFLIFVLVLALLYFLHLFLIETFSPGKGLALIHFSYPFNFGITTFAGLLILLGRKGLRDQIGFIFLGGGIVKFMAFVVFAKALSLDLDKSNFFDFFVPYLTCLLAELFFSIRVLGKENPGNDS